MSRCSKICRNDGRFRGLLFLEGIEVGRDEKGTRAVFPRVSPVTACSQFWVLDLGVVRELAFAMNSQPRYLGSRC